MKRKTIGIISEKEEGFTYIDKIHIINIPKRIHETNPHNIWTGEGMFEINMLVFEFLGRQM